MSEDEFLARYGGLFLVGFEDETALLQFECEDCKILEGGRRLGQHLTRGIVLAVRKEGKVGISFGRYGYSPERNGVPAKGFAVVADTAAFIYGCHEGRLTFVEPMVAQAFFLTQPNVTLPVKTPARYNFPGYYPTRYSVRYEGREHAYVIELGGLRYWDGAATAQRPR